MQKQLSVYIEQVYSWASAEILPAGQSRHLAYPFQVAEDAAQMDVHKMICPFYTPKKMPNVTATFANSVTSKKSLHWANVCFSEHEYFKLGLAEF